MIVNTQIYVIMLGAWYKFPANHHCSQCYDKQFLMNAICVIYLDVSYYVWAQFDLNDGAMRFTFFFSW